MSRRSEGALNTSVPVHTSWRTQSEATAEAKPVPARPGGSTLEGWGRYPVVSGTEIRSEDLEQITSNVPLTRGLGRAYGDAALPSPADQVVAGSVRANRVLSFDPATGDLTAEAGFSLEEMYNTFLPRGFFTPVTPGTRFVTLGGMVACDVHGKNHHRQGTIGRHVQSVRLRVADGRIITCSRTEHPDLFRATMGGMGLTGHILEVSLRLERVPSPWIVCETERIHDLDAFIKALKTAGGSWPMTVGWIDCLSRGASLGRGILYRGRWAEPDEAPRRFPELGRPTPVPFTAPDFFLAPFAVKAFNAVNYLRHGSRTRRQVVTPRSFFYPLDSIGRWNRLYGRRGFAQYQCVLPDAAGHCAARRFLEFLTSQGGASFLCVIKDCADQGEGVLSFPTRGISIALDIPMRRGTQDLVDALNRVVIAEGGRIYLAKDALTRAEDFRQMDPRAEEFLRIRRAWDPDGRFRSAQSVRLFGW